MQYECDRLHPTGYVLQKLDAITIQKVLLCGGLFVWICSKILNEVSDFSHFGFFFKLMLCVAFGLVAFAELLREERYGISDIVSWLIVVLLGASSYVADGSILLQGITLAYFVRNCDIVTIFRVSLIAVSLMLALVIALVFLGAISNGADGSTSVRIRWTLGFEWPSRAPNLFLTICLSLLVLYGRKLNFLVIVACFVVSVVLYEFTDSRAPFLFTVLVLAVAVCAKMRRTRAVPFFVRCLTTLSFLAGAVVIILLSVFYDPDNTFMRFLNGALSNRLNYSHMAFDNVGVSLLGSDVFHDDIIHENFVGYLDSAYLVLLFSFGILAFIVVMTLLTRMASNVNVSADFCLIMAVWIIAAHGMIEWTLIYVQYTPFLLIVFHKRYMFENFRHVGDGFLQRTLRARVTDVLAVGERSR